MSLNPDHTHFLLVDDGTQGQCGAKEVQFRARLERVIADKPNIQRQSKVASKEICYTIHLYSVSPPPVVHSLSCAV